jgi:hypothetical protein
MHRFTFYLLFISCLYRAQNEPMARNAFISNEIQPAFDYWNISRPVTTFHSSFKPYLSSTYVNANDSLVPFRFYAFNSFFLSKTFNEKPQKRNWYNIQFHPIVDIEAGKDGLNDQMVNSATGGMHVKANINNDFTLAASLFGGSCSYPFFLDTILDQKKIIPETGQAYKKPGENNYVFSDYTGYISYSPRNNKVFNFQLGRDKHFIGDGYRSLLLSDFGPAYPFFRINTNVWRLQYHAWYTMMYDVTGSNGIKNNFTNKYGTFHYLSYNITKELNLSLFENIIWRGTDSNQVRTFEVNYLNPIILLRPQEYSVGSPDNSFVGLNISGIVFKTLKLYGQIGLDEFYLKEIRAKRGWWANKQGWQLGAKYINAIGIKGLQLQVEYNEVRPYMYTHGIVDQNYSHYGMPLAHPFGANFREFLGILNYRRNKIQLSWQGMYAIVGKDSISAKSNIGQNIFLSYTTRPFEFGHYTTQGIKTNVLQSHLKLTYYLIPNMLLRLEVGYIQRSEQNSLGYVLENPYFYFGIKSTFWNAYRDF